MPTTKPEPAAALARNVRTRREALKLSQRQLAEATEMDPAAISRIESGQGGERGVGLSKLSRLATALKCTPSDLLQA